MAHPLDELATIHAELVGAIRDVVHDTEDSLLTAGKAVAQALDQAQDTLAQINTLSGPADGTGHSAVAQSLVAQGKTTKDYIAAFNRCLHDLAEETATAISLSASITAALSNFEQLVRMGEYISLYAKIELSRISQDGGTGFVSFSEEFKELIRSIRKLSEDMGDLAQTMTSGLPEVAYLSYELERESKSVDLRLDVEAARIQRSARALDASLDSLRVAGERRLTEVVERAQSAVSLLQFYDPLIQRLQSLDGLMAELRTKASGSNETVAPMEFARPVGDASPNGANPEEPMNSGEVLLF
jgi:methyl-accepting chemotaxis protein